MPSAAPATEPAPTDQAPGPADESGFGGASFASGELGAGDDRGAVQLPDPFLKRVLHVANAEYPSAALPERRPEEPTEHRDQTELVRLD